MEYRSLADLDRLIREWAQSLRGDFDLVVGISQSGTLAAGLLAWHLDIPSAGMADLCQSRRAFPESLDRALTGKPKMLLVDDRATTGDALAQARARIAAAGLAHEIHTGAVIASPEAARDDAVEQFAEVAPPPWLFEWEVMHDLRGSSLCLDFDSVLAPSGAGAPLAPEEEIGWVVTARPESRRYETVVALRNQGVAYRELIMECVDPAEGYARLPADMLIVHGAREAARIARAAGAPVFSIEAGSVLNAGDEPGLQFLCASSSDRDAPSAQGSVRWPVRWLNKLSSTLIGRPLVPAAPGHDSSDLERGAAR